MRGKMYFEYRPTGLAPTRDPPGFDASNPRGMLGIDRNACLGRMDGARGGNRTRNPVSRNQILSLACLPIPPPAHELRIVHDGPAGMQNRSDGLPERRVSVCIYTRHTPPRDYVPHQMKAPCPLRPCGASNGQFAASTFLNGERLSILPTAAGTAPRDKPGDRWRRGGPGSDAPACPFLLRNELWTVEWAIGVGSVATPIVWANA